MKPHLSPNLRISSSTVDNTLLGKPDSESETELSWDLGQYFGADDSAIDFKLKDGKVVDVTVWGF